jgi:hypothetical protein
MIRLVALMAALTFAVAASAQGSGRTVFDISYDYSQVRLRPTYDGHIHGTRSYRLTISGKNQIAVQQSNTSGQYHAEWTNSYQAGSGDHSWHFSGPRQLTKLTDWPQSTTTTIIRVSDSGSCSVRIFETLKPGFSEYKIPMLSRNVFGYYKKTVYSKLFCRVHNE